MKTTLYLSPKHLEMIRQIIIASYPNATVWAYGSVLMVMI